MRIKSAIPNLFTLGNLLCGCIGVLSATNGDLKTAAWMIWVGGFLDFGDGFVARALKVSTELGKQLDSLADMVTFGLLPAIMVYQLWLPLAEHHLLPYLAFLLALFSALRLAKFNLDEEQSHGFKGVPTPSNALMVSSLPFLILEPWGEILNHSYFYGFYSIFVALLLVSDWKLFALKFKDYSIANNWRAYLLLVCGIVGIAFLGGGAFFPVILLYLGLNLVG